MPENVSMRQGRVDAVSAELLFELDNLANWTLAFISWLFGNAAKCINVGGMPFWLRT